MNNFACQIQGCAWLLKVNYVDQEWIKESLMINVFMNGKFLSCPVQK